jgi:curved DNA-binding protein CbpA
MGQAISVQDTHMRMYQNLLAIQSPSTRMQMIQTLLSSPEHLHVARQAGIYGHLLHYTQQVKEGRPAPLLPGEKSSTQMTSYTQQKPSQHSLQGQPSQPSQPSQHLPSQQMQQRPVTQNHNEKAMNYFSACLRILGLEEEVALTTDTLKSAYKKSVVRAHPDKGGSEKEFEAVTRAYAYLGEILSRIHGGRSTEGKVEAPTALSSGRTNDAAAWKMVDPVQLNPSKLNLDAFNNMFEKTRIPDPEESGYGDWLKGSDGLSGAKQFSGKFNRDVFHREFENEQKTKGSSFAEGKGQGKGALVAQELSLASRMGFATELGRTARDDYTVAANERGVAYTDLKKAYTEYNTFSHQTAGIQLSARSMDQVSKERESAPAPLANSEMAALAAAEAAMLRREEQRKMTMAQEAVEENSYFERMKRLVIRNA